jgi:hypothetical protein
MKTKTPASPKQMAFITKLLAEKDHSYFGEDTAADRDAAVAGQTLAMVHASALITALLSAPKKAGAAATSVTISDPDAPATQAQVCYYISLAKKVNLLRPAAEQVSEETVVALIEAWAVSTKVTKGQMSAHLDGMKAKVQGEPVDTSTVVPGLYTLDGEVYLVVESKSSGKPYAKKQKINPTGKKCGWEYEAGLIFKIAKAGLSPVTLEQAMEYGQVTGTCMRCGATLTVAASIAAGIGPICKGYWG